MAMGPDIILRILPFMPRVPNVRTFLVSEDSLDRVDAMLGQYMLETFARATLSACQQGPFGHPVSGCASAGRT
jgi:hypothetical protein